jgi:hypothetical protein
LTYQEVPAIVSEIFSWILTAMRHALKPGLRMKGLPYLAGNPLFSNRGGADVFVIRHGVFYTAWI